MSRDSVSLRRQQLTDRLGLIGLSDQQQQQQLPSHSHAEGAAHHSKHVEANGGANAAHQQQEHMQTTPHEMTHESTTDATFTAQLPTPGRPGTTVRQSRPRLTLSRQLRPFWRYHTNILGPISMTITISSHWTNRCHKSFCCRCSITNRTIQDTTTNREPQCFYPPVCRCGRHSRTTKARYQASWHYTN